MSINLTDEQIAADAALQDAMFDGECPTEDYALVDVDLDKIEERVAAAYAGPSPILVRRDTKQSWSQAKTLDVLKDMHPEQLQAWVDGMNEVAGFAKYRVPADA
ncbi:hypothetical protein QDW16_gp31 [Microbacterium phage Quenya]|uniref:hypothetical protein n=1 Tax=Microbacterium phage Quenya TaxID=2776868 RepID=UPI0018A46DA3|nr:hypothetical protein QDW16_gp31 [Microbacterium phage Quenya]QOP64273.1 hypothetical protein SEA_QUENYA_38 [Microbacterium phage Quenya]